MQSHDQNIDLNRLSEYLGDRILKVRDLQSLFIIRTTHSRWVLKPIHSLTHYLWWNSVDPIIRRNGFHAMPFSFLWENRWLIMQYISGKPASYRSLQQLMKVVDLVARFHSAARNVESRIQPPPSTSLMHRIIQRLEQFIEIVPQLKVYPELLMAADSYLRIGEQAVRQFEKLGMSDILSYDDAEKTIVHRDLASHNIIMGRDGEPWLIDFETVSYDIQLGDVWQLLSRALVEWHWEPDIYTMMLRQYEQVRPLCHNERRAILYLLMFPNDFYRETIGLIHKQRGYLPHQVIPYLYTMARSRDRWLSFLKLHGLTW